jgi:hypothetical protein
LLLPAFHSSLQQLILVFLCGGSKSKSLFVVVVHPKATTTAATHSFRFYEDTHIYTLKGKRYSSSFLDCAKYIYISSFIAAVVAVFHLFLL